MAKQPKSWADWTETAPTYSGADDTGYRIEPTDAHRAVGYTYEEKPAWEEFNWLAWNLGRWAHWVADIFRDYCVVGTGSDTDYPLISSAIAAGYKKIMLITDITIGATEDFTLSNGVLKTNGFKILVPVGIAAVGALKISGSNNEIDVDIELTHDNTPNSIAALVVSGDSNDIKVRITKSTANGVITDAVSITGDGNRVHGSIGISGGGGGITTGLNLSAASEGNQCDLVMNGKIVPFGATYADAGTANDFRIVNIV
jgi:hypothetical protein